MPILEQSRKSRLRQVDRNDQTDVLRVGDDRGGDADDFATAVKQRPARIAVIDRHVYLDQWLLQRKECRREDSIDRRNDAAGQALSEPEWIAERQRVFAHADSVGIAEREDWQLAVIRLRNLQHGNVE